LAAETDAFLPLNDAELAALERSDAVDARGDTRVRLRNRSSSDGPAEGRALPPLVTAAMSLQLVHISFGSSAPADAYAAIPYRAAGSGLMIATYGRRCGSHS
jgi:hypothetical protein